MASTTVYLCVVCSKAVTACMHALACDTCSRWQHRKCRSGISAEQYRRMTKGEIEIQWNCAECTSMEVEESQMNSTAAVLLPPPIDVNVSPLRMTTEPRRTEAEDITFNTTYIISRADTDDGDDPSTTETDHDHGLSFNITNRDFGTVNEPMDRSLPERQLDNILLPDAPVTFEIVDGSSRRRGQKLIASNGYTYTVRRQNGERTYWTCTIRSKKMKCPGSVKQYQDLFTPAPVGHIHPPDPAAAKKVKISKKVKEQAKDRIFEPAAAIVERVMKEMTTSDDFNLPKPDNLTRTANYHRRNRPDNPKDLHFDLDRDYIGDNFIMDDIKMDGSRHIVFGTTNQLDLLGRATRWFIDGTFKIVKEPFYQLLTVNVFVKKGDDTKQVPVVYILMSRRSRQDYTAILTSLKNRLGNPAVEWFMLDYEAATWQAIREVFPAATIKSCVFHWTQRVYRKIQEVGLATNYLDRSNHHEFLRMVMSLPYLPAGQVRPVFIKLQERLPTEEGPLHTVLSYVERTWIDGAVWRPENWSVFRQTVRTNNDLEGWHRRINGRVGRANMPFYALVPLLKGEAETVDLQIRLVTDHLLTKIRRKEYKMTHGRLIDAWDLYEEDKLTTSELLRRISHINGLGATTSTHRDYDDDV